MNGNVVSYLRVSTEMQGRSGLGLEAQRESVARYLNGAQWVILAEFVEVESGGTRERPELAKALALAKRHRATLVVAKLDRLARDTRLILELADSGVKLRFVDMPELQIDGAAGRLVLTQMASFAEFERRIIGERTKAALAAKRARGEKLGHAASLKPINTARSERAKAHADKLGGTLGALQAQGLTRQQMAGELNKLGVPAPRGGVWHPTTVARVMKRTTATAQPANI